jgi:hypothetical protein
MAEDYKHIKKFCIENFHGLKSTKSNGTNLEVMFKKLHNQAYTISHPAESICIGFLI